jgi:hypothetical protein
LDEQIINAKGNQEKLLRTLEKLTQEFQELNNEGQETFLPHPDDSEVNFMQETPDKSLEATNVLAVTQMNPNEDQKVFDKTNLSRKLAGPAHTAPVGQMELYDSEYGEKKQIEQMQQDQYFQNVERRFLERIKFMKKKVDAKRKNY